ncbi:unnamed protein product [Effrenium voratum]|nr:unnamed protein product [Effrenium voratum]
MVRKLLLPCFAVSFPCLVPELRSPEAAERQRYGQLLRRLKVSAQPQPLECDEIDEAGSLQLGESEGHRLRLRVAYDGSRYHGWARVKGGSPLTIAGVLDRAFSLLLRRQVFLCGASRTDAGVHALGQAAHVDVAADRPENWQELWQRKLNEQLPDDIRVRNLEDAPADFHARFSASGKTYVYRLHYGENPTNPLERLHRFSMPLSWVRDFQLSELHDAAALFRGQKNFLYFTSPGKLERKRSTVRNIHDIRVVEEAPGQCRVEVDLDGAVYRMVRNMVGCMVWVARGRISSDCVEELLSGSFSQARVPHFPCLPGHGLCLEKVHYDKHF